MTKNLGLFVVAAALSAVGCDQLTGGRARRLRGHRGLEAATGGAVESMGNGILVATLTACDDRTKQTPPIG
jgi:hypothetical protein